MNIIFNKEKARRLSARLACGAVVWIAVPGLSVCAQGYGSYPELVREPLALNVFIPENPGVDISSINTLEARLAEAVSISGFSGNDPDARFIIVPRIEFYSITTTPTIPPKTVVDGQLHLYIGDGVSSVLFASKSFTVKGIGADTNQAQMNVIARLDPRSAEIQDFINRGKQQISDYYESAYPKLLKDAEAEFGRRNYDAAFNILYSIPGTCSGYVKALETIVKFDKEIRDRENEAILANARAAWSQSPDDSGASEAMALINQIDPSTSAYEGAENLCNEIRARMKELDDRQWKLKVERERAENQRRLAKIQADKEIALADRRLSQQKQAQSAAERTARINASAEKDRRDYNLQLARLYTARDVAKAYLAADHTSSPSGSTLRKAYNIVGWW